ncbi:hypothetical protein AYO20_04608 [Fonsecaea nubica]|uniref:Major facilitator superfamily (MFS) profile domain-containing protein n=1 Tax=Fonsecaea nubica TaxID=856822 RepID=A0A178D493_9EURO|nr:hypothetical protein AYO20_04608 [Fonsecaea nubica]OAL36194.1 hypothetical protein AYO20_04608 [Fonsecaea nubica]
MASTKARDQNNGDIEVPIALNAQQGTLQTPNQLNLPKDEAASQNGPSEKSGHQRKEHLLKRDVLPEQDLDQGIVGWEGQDDPENPRNYNPLRKWTILALVSSMTLISPFASSVFAPAVRFADADFNNTSTILSTFVVSAYVLGYAIGPLFLSPLSEIYGRRIVLNIASLHFVVWQIGCALAPNISSLIVFRLLTGMGGSACLTIGGGTIADMFEKEQRGLAMSIFTAGPLFGPVLGPICGGFIAQGAGWRWVFWTLLIVAGTCTGFILVFYRETNHTVLIRYKTRRLARELNRDDLTSCYDKVLGKRSAKALLGRSLIRPLRLLFLSPIVGLLAIYVALIYGCLYLLFTTVTTVFEDAYHWTPDLTGLAYIGLGLGLLCGQALFGLTSDKIIVRLSNANNGEYQPEMRLTMCLFFAFFVPISFFWYGWSIQAKVHWIVPIIGLLPFGFGMIGIFTSIQTYIIDSYSRYAASGIASVTVTRSFFGAFLPLAGPSLYQSLGYGWGNSLLGFVTLALIPAPVLLHRYGGYLRERYPSSSYQDPGSSNNGAGNVSRSDIDVNRSNLTDGDSEQSHDVPLELNTKKREVQNLQPISRACSSCRERKVSQRRHSIVGARCSLTALDCIYPEPRRRKRRYLRTTEQVESLKTRIEVLESCIKNLTQPADPMRMPPSPERQLAGQSSLSYSSEHSLEDHDEDISWTAPRFILTRHATEEAEDGFQGYSGDRCMFIQVDSAHASREHEIAEGLQYFAASRALVDVGDGTDEQSLQTMIFLILFTVCNARVGTCYSYVTHALTLALRMGLHRSKSKHDDLIEREVGKRIFWVLRLLGSYFATACGMPKLLSDENVDQDLPMEVNDEYITKTCILPQPPEEVCSIAGLNAIIALYKILEQVVRDIYPPRGVVTTHGTPAATYLVRVEKVKDIERALKRWIENLPFGFRPKAHMVSRPLLRTQYLLRMSHAHVQLYLYRPFLHYLSKATTQNTSSPDLTFPPYAAACVQACHTILSLSDEMYNQDLLRGGCFTVLHMIFGSVVTLMFIILDSHDWEGREQSFKDISIGRKAIALLAKCNNTADRAQTILENLQRLENV